MKHVKGKLAQDIHVIEAVVRRFGPLSRSKIHELTHIRRSATSEIVRELLKEGRLLEAGRVNGNSPLGRKQVLLCLNEEHRFVAGVEFDDEAVVAGVLDLHPRVKQTITEPPRLGDGKEGLVKQLLSCTRRALEKAGLRARSLLGIGIADPGLVDSRRGVTVTSSTIDFWTQVPLQAIFEKEFGVPTIVESKTRARTAAERILGAGEMRESMIYVDYGAGIGAGIILDGKFLHGQNCAAGEFGHTHLMENGPPCKCGSFGCLEAIAGARAVEDKIRRAIAGGGASRALALAGGDPEKITVWNVLEAARLGDKTCSHIVAEVASFLGLGLANLVNLFNPSVIVLDRRLELAGQSLLEQIVQIVKRQALTYSAEHAVFRFGRLEREAGVLGVALLVLEKHFEIPLLKPPRFMIDPEAVGSALRGS
ncbi:MAG: ROK family protein [Acidobacteria bacterium]|nr:ROK family protein [Acidobacteriota bacterium]